MKRLLSLVVCFVLVLGHCNAGTKGKESADQSGKPFKVLVLTERGGLHGPFTDSGLKWLEEQGKTMNFTITEINNTKPITEEYLKDYALIVQLDYIPWGWTDDAQKAFIQYIEEGRGGWVGFHHAALLGEFSGYSMWEWMSKFLGDIRYVNYNPDLITATVKNEAANHPVMKGVSPTFVAEDDEWYIFNRSPRETSKVLASVDENTYSRATDIKMGDHPAVWVNENVKARNVYFLMGHSPKLFANADFEKMFRNAIRWASEK